MSTPDEDADFPESIVDEPDILSVDPDEFLPETQGEDPIHAELGEEGEGDLAPEDE